MRVFLIGGPGTISRGTLEHLLQAGTDVSVYTRHTESKAKRYPDVRFLEGHRSDTEALEKAFTASGADIVIDTVCFERSDAERLHAILKDRIRQLIFVSTVDVYGYPLSRLPFREQDPYRPATAGYAQDKLAIECFYLDRMKQEAFPVTIGRPSLSIGPDFCPMMLPDWGFTAVPRMRAGLPLLVPGDGLGLMHVGWSRDVGRMIGRMAGDAACIGKTYTLSDPDTRSRDDYIRLFADVLGVKANLVHIPQELIDVSEEYRSLGRIPHLYRHNMSFSMDAFQQDFPDFKWLSLRSGVEEFITANDERGRFQPVSDDSPEDRIIRRWKASTANFFID